MRLHSVRLKVAVSLVAQFAVVSVLLGTLGHSQITGNVTARVLLIQVPGEDKKTVGYGTAFALDIDGRQYLITAKHMVSRLHPEGDTIQIRLEKQWSTQKVRVWTCDDPVDLAVLVPYAAVVRAGPLETVATITLGEDAYFVGFPYGEFHEYANFAQAYGVVKRAIVAGFEPYPQQKTTLILLDGYNNPGFSGSPVLTHSYINGQLTYKVAGVVVGFRNDAGTVLRKKEEITAAQITPEDIAKNRVVQTNDGRIFRVEDTDELVRLNSGIAWAWSIDPAIKLIHKHPDGPLVGQQESK